MAQNSGFFNAFLSGGVYDRTYNANDYCDNLATVIKSGVVYSSANDLEVTAYSGMTIKVGIGRAWILGHWFYNDTAYTGLTLATAPSGNNSRIDRVVLRLDTSTAVRSVALAVKTGTAAASPTAPAIMRSGTVYEIALADITVGAGAVTITNSNITDKRADGNVCGWASSVTPAIMSMIQRYEDRITLTAATDTVQFNIAQYDATEAGIVLDIYVNGIYELPTQYSLSGNTITFTGTLIAGTVIDIVLLKSIDATGLASAADLLAELQQDVADLGNFNNYHYVCNGINDNVVLSNMAQSWLNGGTDYGSMRIYVYGTVGISAPYGGTGASNNYYRWFSFGQDLSTNRKIEFDFSNAGQINIPVPAGTYNYIFYGNDVSIIGANVNANQISGTTVIEGFSSSNGVNNVDDSRFWLTASGNVCCARTGTFRNCRMSCTSISGNAYCFSSSSTGLLRVEGGEYYAYTGNSGAVSAVVIGASSSAITILYSINCPTISRAGFYQKYAINITAGFASITDTITALTVVGVGSNIRGTLVVSRAGTM